MAANVDAVTAVTLSGSTLTFTGNHNIATTAGADGILFLPDGNLAIAGQGGGTSTAQIHEIATAGAAVANVNTPTNGSRGGTNIDGSYHLTLSSRSPTATLYTMCNGECGANLSRTTPSGGGLVNASTGTNITVIGGTSQDVRGIIFHPVNGKWYYGTAGDGSTAGTFATVSFSRTTATLTQLPSNVPAHGLAFDSFTKNIIFNSGNEIDQFNPTTGTVVSSVTDPTSGNQFDQSAVDG